MVESNSCQGQTLDQRVDVGVEGDQSQTGKYYKLPKSPETSGLRSLQPACCLWRILTAESLPLRLKPPVSSNFPGPSEQLAIPQPSTQSAVVVTVTVAGLHDGTTAGTEGAGGGSSCSN